MASAAVQTPSNPFSDSRDRRKTQAAPKKEIWSTLLNSVSSGKRLPEKQLLLLGGTPSSQKEFLESLSTESGSNNRRANARKPPPIANQYALGYTYQDVLDADHEETLARLSIYTLSSSSPAFAPLLRPLLTPKTLPHTLLVVLLDWSHPWLWVRQLRDWIRLLRSVILSSSDETKQSLESGMRQRSNTVASSRSEGGASEADLPLGPGEWDEHLGVPLCVVVQNTDKMAVLEREHNWKDEQFDYVGQFVRTILLKHGGSLIYTMPSSTSASPQTALQQLVHGGLGISSSLAGSAAGKKDVSYEVSRREATLVPAGWDSWAKIRMMADNFDPEEVSKLWSASLSHTSTSLTEAESEGAGEEEPTTALYASIISNPKSHTQQSAPLIPAQSLPASQAAQAGGIETPSKDVQLFLSEQAKILEEYTIADRKEARAAAESKKDSSSRGGSIMGENDASRHVEEHIGPVSFNVGGITVDAEEMVRRIKDREKDRTQATEGGAERVKSPVSATPKGGESAEMENQRLKDFFAGLAKKGGAGGSAANSPRRGVGES